MFGSLKLLKRRSTMFRCLIHIHLVYLVTVFMISTVSGKKENDFCERDEITGSCKSKVSSKQDEGEDDGPCWMENETKIQPKITKKDEKLVRLDGVKIGHEQQVEIGGKSYKLITRALRPLLFEIPNFMTKEEMEEIKEYAEATGMFDSKAKGGLTEPDYFKPSAEPGKSLGPSGTFVFWDWDQDDVIDARDIMSWTRYYSFLVMNETDVKEMFERLDFPYFDDGKITREEFNWLNTQGVDDYINVLVREHPRFRQRFSEQCYLSMSRAFSNVTHNLRERVVKLTKLPRRVVYGCEHLQVVKYTPYGHYHAHHDSETHERTDLPCCHHTDSETVLQYQKCKLCRFITLMTYLNDVEEGGETAFPVADNATFDANAFRIRGTSEALDTKDLYNLSHNCYASNLVVTPRAGTAIMWYNHLVDKESGLLGELEERSLHGGCDVKHGEKWIANVWITAPYANSVNETSMYFDETDYLEAEKRYS